MQAVVLAAGRSSRFWPLNTQHKCLMQLCGRSLIEHTLDGLVAAGITDIIIVQGPDEAVAAATEAPDAATVRYVVQDEPRGMGNAVEQAEPLIEGRFVVTGPYRYDIERLLGLLPSHETCDGAVIGVPTDHPERYGMLAIDGDRATGIVEKPEPSNAPSDLKVVSTYLLDTPFFEALEATREHEYSFEDALEIFMDTHEVKVVRLDAETDALKYPWDLFAVKDAILTGHEPVIDATAEIADSAVIEDGVHIGPGTIIHEHAVVRAPGYIGADCVIGNNTVIRARSVLEDGVTVGANAEVRNCIMQPRGSMHAGFFGDSVFGQAVSIGAGTVTANRLARKNGERPEISVHVEQKDERVATGRDRLGVFVGDEAEIGTQCNLMPGVCIGARSFIGPSTMVKRNIADDLTVYTETELVERDRERS